MTTIAYKNGIMAADTMGSWSGDINYGVPKLAKTDRFLLGFSGSYPFAHPMYEWIVGKEDKPLEEFYREPPEFDAGQTGITVLVAPIDGGELWYFAADGNGCPLWGKKFEAIGSGGRVALGAMYSGASAAGAVQAAIALDDGTGGEVVRITKDDDPCTIFSLDMNAAKV